MIGSKTVILPGGLWFDGSIHKKAVLKPITGKLEARILDILNLSDNLPVKVSLILGEVLATLGNYPADRTLAAMLCVADRQYLMLHLADLLGGEDLWLSYPCRFCNEKFDLSLRRTDLLMKKAGPEYPVISVSINGAKCIFRVPVGRDQEELAVLPGDETLSRLIDLCVVSVDGSKPEADLRSRLIEPEITKIETALEEASPHVATALQAACPECGQAQMIPFNPYDLGGISPDNLEEEVHTLAFYYHWSENDILQLTREKRRRYIRLIGRERGFSS